MGMGFFHPGTPAGRSPIFWKGGIIFFVKRGGVGLKGGVCNFFWKTAYTLYYLTYFFLIYHEVVTELFT